MINILAQVLPRFSADFGRLHVLLVDERVVPKSSPDSLLGEYLRQLGSPSPILDFPRSDDLSSASWASSYEEFLRRLPGLPVFDGLPCFDAVLLGIGEDGHTASLFPGRDLKTSSWVLAVENSPKPPPLRVSFSLPVLANSSHVIFIATGSSKASILKRIIDGDESLPSALVKPRSGVLEFLVDESAASKL